MSIQSNTVLITGASRGLGANFSKVLAHDGFKIIGIGRNLHNLKSVISSLPNQDLGHSYLELGYYRWDASAEYVKWSKHLRLNK